MLKTGGLQFLARAMSINWVGKLAKIKALPCTFPLCYDEGRGWFSGGLRSLTILAFGANCIIYTNYIH